MDVSLDQYPYTASHTGSAAMFPQWSLEGGRTALLERLQAPESRARIKAEVARRIRQDRGAGDPEKRPVQSVRFRSVVEWQDAGGRNGRRVDCP